MGKPKDPPAVSPPVIPTGIAPDGKILTEGNPRPTIPVVTPPADPPLEPLRAETTAAIVTIPLADPADVKGYLSSRVHGAFNVDERFALARMRLGLIAQGATIEGKFGPRPVESNWDVLRFMVRAAGGLTAARKTHKANGMKIDESASSG